MSEIIAANDNNLEYIIEKLQKFINKRTMRSWGMNIPNNTMGIEEHFYGKLDELYIQPVIRMDNKKAAKIITLKFNDNSLFLRGSIFSGEIIEITEDCLKNITSRSHIVYRFVDN